MPGIVLAPDPFPRQERQSRRKRGGRGSGSRWTRRLTRATEDRGAIYFQIARGTWRSSLECPVGGFLASKVRKAERVVWGGSINTTRLICCVHFAPPEFLKKATMHNIGPDASAGAERSEARRLSQDWGIA